MKKVIVSVTNDLVSDQRVHKVCITLSAMGFEVLLVGRKLPGSPPLEERAYKTKRLRLLFTKGPLFYACFNLRLFILLLFRSFDLLVANDLDTLLANHLAAGMKSKPLVYDTHEYFTEVPELQGRKAKKVWEFIEARIFPGLKDVITVNDSIAQLYQQKYGIKVNVVRNMPRKRTDFKSLSRSELGIPEEKRLIILQGAGINIQRGAEEAVLAMKYVDNAILLIVGGGDVLPRLKKMQKTEDLEDKLRFYPRQSIDKLYAFTSLADIGLSLDKDTNLNYRYSLPNKIFDYIQCGTPVLASGLPEVRRIIEGYDVGMITESHRPEDIARQMQYMLQHDYKKLKRENLRKAAAVLVWENEEEVLHEIYGKYL